MPITLRRNAEGKVNFHTESTEGCPAMQMVQGRLGPEAHIEPADLMGTLRLQGDTLVAVRSALPAGKAAAKQFGVRLPALPPSGYRIQKAKHPAGRALLVVGGDLFGMLAGLADVLCRSALSAEGLTYRGGERTEKPAFPLRYYWTWDHSTNWTLDDPGTQVMGACNAYLKQPETFVSDYQRLIDHCVEARFNGVIIWGFLRDTHGGEVFADRIARYARDRGVAIMPGAGTTGYGGVYYEGRHPANLETYLALHPERGNQEADGRKSSSELSAYSRENQQWIKTSLEWLYGRFAIGGVNLENMDLLVDHSAAAKRARAKIKSGEKDYFKDQFVAYRTALEVGERMAPTAWNTYATYTGFGLGQNVANAGADMGVEPHFAKRFPPSSIAQWTLTGMLRPEPAPLRDWLTSGTPASVYDNPNWPRGLRPPTPRSAGFLHHGSQCVMGARRNALCMSAFAEACLRGHEAGLEGLGVYGEVTSRTLPAALNYLATRHWTYHPGSSLEEFAAAELTPRVGGEQAARDFIEALMLLEEGKPEAAYKIARPRSWEFYPYPRGNAPDPQAGRDWWTICEWTAQRQQPAKVFGFDDVI